MVKLYLLWAYDGMVDAVVDAELLDLLLSNLGRILIDLGL